jgi:hypothetical protein
MVPKNTKIILKKFINPMMNKHFDVKKNHVKYILGSPIKGVLVDGVPVNQATFQDGKEIAIFASRLAS